MLLYSPTISARLQYIATTVFSTIECTNNVQAFIESNEPKINYSNQSISPQELWIKPHGLLEETGIKEQTIEVIEWQNLKIFFKTEGTIPFDIFSASFYLLTRYEEYLPHKKDMYGRYAHENSIAFKHDFLQYPLVNLWMMELNKQFPFVATPKKIFSFIPTYDIDIAYAYKHNSIIRNVVGFFKNFIKGNIENVIERSQVYTGKKKDPFDVYSWLNQLHKKYKLHATYFFLVAKKIKAYDRNINPNSSAMQQLIKEHAEKYTIGIHPSWQSGDNENLLLQEINQLKNSGEQKVICSRQHYIRMSLPTTYTLLQQQGIEDDYSMGYGSINGFRASYTLPYKWYNLENETITSLIIHPFCYMDANAFFEEKLSVEQAETELQFYHDIVKKVNGQLITIFHNHFLTEQPEWLPWRNMYANFLTKNFSSYQ